MHSHERNPARTVGEGASPPAGDGLPGAPGPGASLPACRLERLIGRPRESWTAGNLAEVVREHGIRLVSLMHVGGDGWLKTLDFVPQNREHLRDILGGGERADGSSLFAGLVAGASDIVLQPRPSGAFLDPFSPLPTLAVLCGHADREGRPLPQSPDTVVRRAAERLTAETGVHLHALGEVEFFLGRRSSETDLYGASDRGYHATSPFVFGESLRRRALALLAEMGVAAKYAHSEVGYVEAGETEGVTWEQHEIELGLAPLPEAADAVVLTHWVLRNLADREHLRLNFDPVLRRGHAGTGLHFHFSPMVDGAHRGGRDGDGRLTPEAQWLIAGLARLGGALMAFGNRGESSFVRLAQAREAPSAICWGEYDRSALVRLPILPRTVDGRRVAPPTIEFRLPDGSAHPHLLLAGVAQAMTDARGRPGLDAFLESVHTATLEPGAAVAVPRTRADVGAALAAHREVFEHGDVFPAAMLDQVLAWLGAPAVPAGRP